MNTDQAIRKHRMGTLRIVGAPGQKVRVRQLAHEFQFGTALAARMFRRSTDPGLRKEYLHLAATRFNAAVHENALKWYATERRRPGGDYRDADRVIRWCERHGLAMRGHCLFWEVERFVQDWVRSLDDRTLRRELRRRALEVTRRYRGRIAEYDVNNEVLHGSYYTGRLGAGIFDDMFRWARQGDRRATLYVNDFNILTGRDVGKYERQVQDLIDRGVPVGGIGLQGHYGGRVNVRHVRRVLDRLGRFGLPIKITEFDQNVEDEQTRAEDLPKFYRACFAHPAVAGILMWGFWEGAHWRPTAALWTKDFRPTAAAEAYDRLVLGEWWTQWEGRLGDNGECEVPVFFGRHKVRVGRPTHEVFVGREEGKLIFDARY